jgi:alpha-L-fucosidase
MTQTPIALSRRRFLQAAAPAPFALKALAAPDGPAPYGALPSKRQLAWHEMELYAFLHFTVNTFTDKEWGYGDEDPSIFNPTHFDADAIVSGLKAAGMRGVILTCKHHDGFCLWPTKTTEHSVAKSTWRNGKGDVVKEVSEAARKQGLKFGVYLSPWDRNNALYGKPEYVNLYRSQLRELLTQYGPVYEVWHDGANGGDGYYGGAKEKRVIDKRTYYGWPQTWELVRSLQPGAAIFSDVGPDIRWVGNENGYASDTCWETYDPIGPDGGAPAPGFTRDKEGQTGTRNGSHWMPPECDVSIRPGWFWHAAENGKVKTPAQLLDLYYKSVGRGGSMLLNVPPDRRGQLHENDLASLAGFGARIRKTFAEDLAARATAKASNTRGNQKAFDPRNLLDSSRQTYWTTDDSAKTPEVVISLPRETRFSVIRLREYLPLGQRVEAFELDLWQNGAWTVLTSSTSIGACRLIRTKAPMTTERLRLRVTQAAVCPALSEIGVFLEP